MTLQKWFAALFCAAMFSTAIFVSSCNDTTTTPSVFIPNAPTNLMALSLSETSIRLMFTASTSESNTSFKDYFMTVTNGTASNTFSINKGNNLIDVSSLSAGKVYHFSLVARSTDSMSAPITIDWAPAKRFSAVRAYDSTSAKGSGVSLVDGQPRNISSADEWDLCFSYYDRAFGSPNSSGYVQTATNKFKNGLTPKITQIFADAAENPILVNADSLNAVFEAKAINDTSSSKKKKVDGVLGVSGITKPFVFYCQTQDNRFAKVLVKANGGKVIQTDGDGDYVECDITVQTAIGIPYALKHNFPAFEETGIKASKTIHITNSSIKD